MSSHYVPPTHTIDPDRFKEGYYINVFGTDMSMPTLFSEGDTTRVQYWREGWNNQSGAIPFPIVTSSVLPDPQYCFSILNIDVYVAQNMPDGRLWVHYYTKRTDEDISQLSEIGYQICVTTDILGGNYGNNPPQYTQFGVFPYIELNDAWGTGFSRLSITSYIAWGEVPPTMLVNFYDADHNSAFYNYCHNVKDVTTYMATQGIVYCSLGKHTQYRLGIELIYRYGPTEGFTDSDTDLYNWYNGLYKSTTDPYEEGGTSTLGGGDGTYTHNNEPVGFPRQEVLSALNLGFVTAYVPTSMELVALSGWLWGSSGIDITQFKRLFQNPWDAIIGLSILPLTDSQLPKIASTFRLGNIDSNVSTNELDTHHQYVTVNCGTLDIDKFVGSYLDFDPYTKIDIYLPYIGTHPLNVNDVMGQTIEIEYRVDVLSGACVCNIMAGNHVLYTYTGHCSASVPMTGTDFGQIIRGVISSALAIGNMVENGIPAPYTQDGVVNNPSIGEKVAGALGGVATGAISAIQQIHTSVAKSGSVGGTAGLLGIQHPYVTITRPKPCIAANENEFLGYPSHYTAKLSECGGYTEYEKIHLENMSCTDAERGEIETLLTTGVIL